MTLADRCSRDSIEYLAERVKLTERSLARYAGTPCEPDYREMLESAQRRLIDAIAAARAQLETPETRIAFDNDPANGPTAYRIIAMTEAGYPDHDDEHADRY
jgi:hypothetical protein